MYTKSYPFGYKLKTNFIWYHSIVWLTTSSRDLQMFLVFCGGSVEKRERHKTDREKVLEIHQEIVARHPHQMRKTERETDIMLFLHWYSASKSVHLSFGCCFFYQIQIYIFTVLIFPLVFFFLSFFFKYKFLLFTGYFLWQLNCVWFFCVIWWDRQWKLFSMLKKNLPLRRSRELSDGLWLVVRGGGGGPSAPDIPRSRGSIRSWSIRSRLRFLPKDNFEI